ncbi:MAG TPA: polysaccharide biosynthesis C-terminal domain-containing protein [Edaphocola sp.]|nr:polysaccharide biosynthesis C-terminal domain-containing protein [Edaphocola sp.]
MSEVKKLAGQTIWYGMSSVAAKLLNSLMTPLLTYFLVNKTQQIEYGSIAIIYSYFALLNVVFTYGMETGYFRFCNLEKNLKEDIYNTAFASLLISTLLFCIGLYVYRVPIEQFVVLDGHLEYINLAIIILFFDTLQTIPFAKLRQDQKPRKYAFIRVLGIVINIIFVFFFLVIMPKINASYPETFLATLAQKYNIVSFVLFANVLQSVITFLALFQEWKGFRFQFNKELWKKMFRYSSPMVFIGLAGVVNEVIDRQMLIKLINNTSDYAQRIQAIYSANYKLSIVVTMFITAFRMAAEPFFFSKAADKNAPILYAKVTKWFVITVCIAYLTTALFLNDVWKLYIGSAYHSGLFIVPILLFANVMNGIYYNLSTWYKITDRMWVGVIITAFGALITFSGNYLFIPKYEMLAGAWTTLVAYTSMVIISYFVGQKYYPIPYNVKRIGLYLFLMVGFYLIQDNISKYFDASQYIWLRLLCGIVLFLSFLFVVLLKEKKELQSMPFIGKFLK